MWVAPVNLILEADDTAFLPLSLCQALPRLSQIYYDIQPARGQGGNFMQEMLGSLMGGGGGPGSSDAAPAPVRHAPPPRVPKLDGLPTAVEGAPADEELDLD